MKYKLRELEKRIKEIEVKIDPPPKPQVKFVLNEKEIDGSLENVTWVLFKI